MLKDKHWQLPTDAKIGDEVSYRDVNLWFDRGVITRFDKGERGGDVFVRWHRGNMGECENLLSCLYVWR